ncbi:MAG TPA: glycosyltransferase [Acidimicrobiales bacterium]|nr:glycosyltransferase [Acidimicrobiales bacterium]
MLPYPATSGGRKRTLRLLEAAERAGARPHLLATGHAEEDRSAAALRGRGWDVDLSLEVDPGPLDRLRQHLRRRPTPYDKDLAARLRHWHHDPPAFVQAEHPRSAYYRSQYPTERWILSMHNVDSAALASVARTSRPGVAWARAWNRSLASRTVERTVVPAATAVLCVGDDDAAQLEALGGTIVVAPNGIDREILAIPDTLPADEVVLCTGRLDYAPNALGIERFVREGWPRVAQARPGARLRVVGGGIQASLARAIADAPRAEAPGVVDDIVVELTRARLVVVPVWQGGGVRLKALEALGAARPVVGTPFGMAGSGFVPDHDGLVAHQPADLGDAAVALLADPERSAALAASGRARVQPFEWSRALAPAEALYARLVEEASTSHDS